MKLPTGLLTHEARRAAELSLARRFFIVRISGNAGYDSMTCRRCGAKHPYLTLACIPRPWPFRDRGIYAQYKEDGAAGVTNYLSPHNQDRQAEMRKLVGPLADLPDLSTSHPQLVRSMKLDVGDWETGAIPLGVPEEISIVVARRFVQKINDTGIQPPLIVPGLEEVS